MSGEERAELPTLSAARTRKRGDIMLWVRGAGSVQRSVQRGHFSGRIFGGCSLSIFGVKTLREQHRFKATER